MKYKHFTVLSHLFFEKWVILQFINIKEVGT